MKPENYEKLTSISWFVKGILPAITLFVLTFCGLALEVSLTRLYSVIFLQGYVYLLISLSMAGLGFGAVWVYYLSEKSLQFFFQLLSLFPLLTFGLIIGVNHVATQFLFSLLPTILLFVYIGASTTYLFQRTSLPVSLLYFVDLCGAALGAISSFYLLNTFGAVKAIVLLLVLTSIFSGLIVYLFFRAKKYWLISYLLLVAISITFFCLDLTHVVSPRYNRLKDMSRVLADKKKNPRIAETRWTAFGRSDLVETDNPLLKTLYIDGAAGTKMVRFENGHLDPALRRALFYDYIGGIPLLPIPPEQRESAVVIGSGGGIDVVALLTADYQKITAVEINSDFIDVVKKYSAYNGSIYNGHPKVAVFNQEGRTFIRSANRQFDLIHMSLPIIKSARNIGSYALTENHLFTYEAFNEYWEALKPDGYLIVVAHYTGEAYRLVANIVKAFQSNGMSSQTAMKHIVLIGRDAAPALILRKKAFTQEDAEVYYGMIRTLRQEGSSNYIPYVDQHIIQYHDWETNQVKSKPMINELLYGLSRGTIDLETFIDRQPENVSWISDDSPFFYQMKKKLPVEIITAFFISFFILILVALLFRNIPKSRIKPSKKYFYYFCILGSAFMMVEIAMIQKFVLFWGHQTLALACLLSLILLSTGIGSYVSGFIKMSNAKLKISLVLILFLIGITFALSGHLLNTYAAGSKVVKITLSAIIIFPVFFMMGFPFPTLLERVKQQPDGTRWFPWMIGINSISTLIGGCLAIMIAMLRGYSYVLFSGMLLYGSIIPLLLLLEHRSKMRIHYEFKNASSSSVPN
jgi:SAM-dependent methyltransferase